MADAFIDGVREVLEESLDEIRSGVADSNFVAWTYDAIARCLAVLGDATWDPGLVRTPNWNPHLTTQPRSAAYAIPHALAHLGEHVGHLHMTRELLRPNH